MPDINKVLGRLQPVDLRDFWEDEARQFTPWLALPDNLKLLSDVIGIELEFEGTESRVGIFKADIVAKEVGTDDRVIIENQLESTDHDRLGKLLTYAAGLGAKVVVWVAEKISDDHGEKGETLLRDLVEPIQCASLRSNCGVSMVRCPPQSSIWFAAQTTGPRALARTDAAGEPTETKLLQLEFWSAFVE